jgi:DNA-binding FadR family transcriptional regulator
MAVPRQRADPDKRSSRAEQVAADVEEEILAARLPVGAHLGRRVEFMQRFSISPMIMSETLRILRGRGLVTVRPGTGGGIFVAALLPQVRLGGMDLWFHESGTHPLDLFEARLHLEAQLTPAAFDRATEGDIAAMRGALDRMTQARDAASYLEAVMTLHRGLVAAARVPVLDAMHQTVVTALRATLSRAIFIDGYEPLLEHSIAVHQGIVEAIAGRNQVAFHKVMLMHNDDLVRADDPARSPGHLREPQAP